MNIVLLGGPGSGKGTQAQLLVAALHLPHVASGDLFREHLKKATALGRQARLYMDRGELVPDEVTIAMVRERLSQPDCAQGVILDGFPRTIAQDDALRLLLAERGQRLDLVAYIKVSEDTLMARSSGRWTCQKCGAVFHLLFKPPRVAGKCDICGGKLYQREDDTPAVQHRRIQVYFQQTAPLIERYRQQELLVEIDGEQEIANVQAQLLAAVKRM
jgi:adenylate kinase